MDPVKRVEIVIDQVHLPAVLAALAEAGATSYSVLHDVTGKGDRGMRRGDGLTGVFRNACVIAAVPADDAARIVEAIRPILHKAGGMCLLSDALWVVH
jgi:nitrogen regulatory protein PII